MHQTAIESVVLATGRGAESSRHLDEPYRMKIVVLRDGIRRIFAEHGVSLEPGASNNDLMAVLGQALGDRNAAAGYREDVSADWSDEYRRMVACIAAITSQPVDPETEPQEIIGLIGEHLAA